MTIRPDNPAFGRIYPFGLLHPGELDCQAGNKDSTAAFSQFCRSKTCYLCLFYSFRTDYRSDKSITGGTYLILSGEKHL